MSAGDMDEGRAELRRVVRSFLADRAPRGPIPVAPAEPAAAGRDAWDELVGLGLVGLLVPEDLGGQGATFADAAVVLEECGRALTGLPFLATTVALGALVGTGTAAGRQVTADLCDRGVAASIAFAEEGWAWRPLSPRTIAERVDGGYRLTGRKVHVPDAETADRIVVSAALDGAAELFVVRLGVGVAVGPRTPLDLTRSQAVLELEGAPAELVSDPGRPQHGVRAAVDLLHAATAAEAVGGSRRCLEMTVQHLRDRVQFGRPIGTFQALQHRCADLAIAIDAAAATSAYAASAHGTPEFPVVAPMAAAVCAETFSQVAGETIQLHGGIGFTWEHDAHLYFKRAKSSELLYGSPRELRRVVGERAGFLPVRAG